jgi:hypothetical protein
MSELIKILEADPAIGRLSELGLTSEELLLFEIAPEVMAGVLLTSLAGVASASTIHRLRNFQGDDESSTDQDKFKARLVANKLSNRAFGNLPDPPSLRDISTGEEDIKRPDEAVEIDVKSSRDPDLEIDVMGSQEAEDIERIGREEIIGSDDPRSIFFGGEEEEEEVSEFETVPLLSEGRARQIRKRQRWRGQREGTGEDETDPLLRPDETKEEKILRQAKEKYEQIQRIKERIAKVGAGGSALAGGIAGIIKWMTDQGYDPDVIGKVEDDLINKPEKPDQDKDNKQQVANIINRNLNPTRRVGQQLAQTKVPMRIFKLPPDTESYSYVELVRQANANYNFNNNLFNTGF